MKYFFSQFNFIHFFVKMKEDELINVLKEKSFRYHSFTDLN